MSEDDWEAWRPLDRELGDKIEMIGDELFVTNVDRMARGIEENGAFRLTREKAAESDRLLGGHAVWRSLSTLANLKRKRKSQGCDYAAVAGWQGNQSGCRRTGIHAPSPGVHLLYQIVREYYPAFKAHLAAQGTVSRDMWSRSSRITSSEAALSTGSGGCAATPVMPSNWSPSAARSAAFVRVVGICAWPIAPRCWFNRCF